MYKKDVAFVAVALVLAYGIYTTAGLALNTSVPVVAVTSGSMEPELHRGDMILVHGKSYENIEVGDIIVYDTGSMPVPIIHRVIEKNETALQTKGDALQTQHDFEKYITEEQILGTQVLTVPMLGYFKLAPTCFYLEMVQGRPPATVCP